MGKEIKIFKELPHVQQNVKTLEEAAQDLAQQIVELYISSLKLTWKRQHGQKRSERQVSAQAEHKRIEIEHQIKRLEAELNKIYADLGVFYSQDEASCEA